jgi:release factor glutamine methyltransferase
MRLGDFIAAAIKRLKEAGIDSADLDARLLAGHALKCDRARLLSQQDRVLTPTEMQKLGAFIDCRARHEPVARIIGKREFWSLSFGLNHATLEPRPDSETLIETILKLVRSGPSPLAGGELLRILDLGTGTGCLLLALLHELPNASGLGVDKALPAVEQAEANAKGLKLENRATFKTGDWFDGIREQFDIIVSNPPYIAHKDLADLMPEVRDYDPPLALDGGEDGLAVYRLLVPRLHEFLKPGGIVAFEVGIGQARSVGKMFVGAGLAEVAVHKDLGRVGRVVTAHIP